MCIVGVNSLLKSQQKTFIWDHRGLSIILKLSLLKGLANVLDKTLLFGNFVMVCIRPLYFHSHICITTMQMASH